MFFISDACNKLLIYLEYDFYRVSILFRSFYEIVFFAAIVIFINRERTLFLKTFLSLFIMFIGGQILFSLNMNYHYDFLENINIFNKYFFVFVIYFSVYKLQDFPEKFHRITRLLENIFLFNSIAAIVGFIFQIDFLRTYVTQSYRYGYSGFIPAQNEATFFYFLSLLYFYYQHYILKLKSRKFFIVLLSCFLLGTKGIYLFLVLLLLFHFLYHSTVKAKLISLIIVCTVYFGGSWYLKTESAQKLLNYFISKTQESDWITMILSGRNATIVTKGPEVLRNWNIMNFFIGGQDQKRFLIEMDIIDMFLFFGIIGSIGFLALYFLTLFRFSKLKPFNLFFVISFFSLAFFAGHFFSSAVNALYLCLVSMYLYTTQKKPASFHE